MDGGKNDQYVWDLQSFATPPLSAQSYYIYAVIDDGQTKVISKSSSQVAWTNGSFFQFTGPISQGISADRSAKVKIPFKLRDLQVTQDEYILVAASTWTTAPLTGGQFVPTLASWIINTSATVAAGNPYESVSVGLEITAATSVDTFVIWNTSLAYGTGGGVALTNSTYYIYAVLDVNADGILDSGDQPISTAPGTITLTNTGSTPTTKDLSLSPSAVVAEAGEPLSFDIVPNSSGKNVTLFSYYLSVDTSAVTLVDADAVTAGTQPFAIGPFYSAWQVFTNRVTTSGKKYLLDLVMFDSSGDTPNGTNVLTTLSATAKGTASGSGLQPFDVFFDSDAASNRETALFIRV